MIDMPSNAGKYNRTRKMGAAHHHYDGDPVRAGSRHSPTMAYSALNELLEEQTGQPKFDFGLQQDRDAIGALLSDVNDRTLADVEAEMGRKVVYPL